MAALDAAVAIRGRTRMHDTIFHSDRGSEYTSAACAQAVPRHGRRLQERATDAKAPDARQCVDPFHVIKLANEAIDKVRRSAWNVEREAHPKPKRPPGRPPKGSPSASDRPRRTKHTRWALVKDPDDLTDAQLDVLHRLRRERSALYRCWQLN